MGFTLYTKEGEQQMSGIINRIHYIPDSKFNVISGTKLLEIGFVMLGNQDNITFKKGKHEMCFDLKIKTPEGMVFAINMRRHALKPIKEEDPKDVPIKEETALFQAKSGEEHADEKTMSKLKEEDDPVSELMDKENNINEPVRDLKDAVEEPEKLEGKAKNEKHVSTLKKRKYKKIEWITGSKTGSKNKADLLTKKSDPKYFVKNMGICCAMGHMSISSSAHKNNKKAHKKKKEMSIMSEMSEYKAHAHTETTHARGAAVEWSNG
jgi:hypothetical protein